MAYITWPPCPQEYKIYKMPSLLPAYTVSISTHFALAPVSSTAFFAGTFSHLLDSQPPACMVQEATPSDQVRSDQIRCSVCLNTGAILQEGRPQPLTRQPATGLGKERDQVRSGKDQA